jgi:hypothetical protein
VATRVDELKCSIASTVRELKMRQARTAGLLSDRIDLASNTLTFLRRLVTQPAPTYTSRRGLSTAGQSVLVDSRA